MYGYVVHVKILMEYISFKIIQILSISVANHALCAAVYIFLKNLSTDKIKSQVEIPGKKLITRDPRTKPATRNN